MKKIIYIAALVVIAAAAIFLFRSPVTVGGSSVVAKQSELVRPTTGLTAQGGSSPDSGIQDTQPTNLVAQHGFTAPSLSEAVSTSLAQTGPQDNRLRSFYFQAKEVCLGREQAALIRSSLPQESRDTKRDWAAEELDRRCARFPAQIDEVEKAAVPTLYDVLSTDGKDEAVRQAKANLRSADNAIGIIDAGETLLTNGAFPKKQLFGNEDPGYPALSLAVRNAARLRECELAAQCGPDSFATLVFCAEFGCRQGVTLPQGMRDAMPARDYDATMRVRGWLASQHSKDPI